VYSTGLKKALVIGISDYDNLESLSFCKNDGKEMSSTLEMLDYEIASNDELLGYVKWEKLRDAIYDFFSEVTKPDDILLFYYSGHGIPDVDGGVYLATSETEPFRPSKRGFNFNELTKLMQDSPSTRIVVILDCCYSGSAKVSKGHADDAAKLGTYAIDRHSKELSLGEGKCILAASQAQQEAYVLEEHNHSLFTYYLLEALKGKNKAATNDDGYITVDSLSKYIYNTIMSLPPEKRPKQKPVRKVEASGDIILGYYPKFAGKQKYKTYTEARDSIHELGLKESLRKTEAKSEDPLSGRDLESEVKRYIQDKKGHFSISQCAIDLDTSVSEISEIVGRLFRRRK